MVLSGSQWFLESHKQNEWDRNNATAGESMHTELCTAFCRTKIHVFVLATTGNLQKTKSLSLITGNITDKW